MTTPGYLAAMTTLLARLEETQSEPIRAAGAAIGRSIADGGVLHVFGSGHSHMMAEEVFCRAGGLVAVNAILDPNLTFYGTVDPDALERTEGYAKVIVGGTDLRAGEVVIVASNSGINAVPSELAQWARRAGCTVVALTSAAAYVDVPSRHSSGLRLTDEADIVIDTGVPLGDAVLRLGDLLMGSASTVVGAAALNCVTLEAAGWLMAAGHEPPVLVSVNAPGGGDRNLKLAADYRHRLPHLRIS